MTTDNAPLQAAAQTQAAPQAVYIVDAAALQSGHPSGSRQAWPRPQMVDSISRLSVVCKVLKERLPQARLLIFVEEPGVAQLHHGWQSGSLRAVIHPSSVQCVPFGCSIVSIMLELARMRSAAGCEVVIVSNSPEVVKCSMEEAPARWRHQGFMFIEADLILPGLDVTFSSTRSLKGGGSREVGTSLLEALPSSAARQGRAVGGKRSQRGASAGAGAPGAKRQKGPGGLRHEDDDCETLPDSQIDGAPLDESLSQEGGLTGTQSSQHLYRAHTYSEPQDVGREQGAEALSGGVSQRDMNPEDPYADTLKDADVQMGLRQEMPLVDKEEDQLGGEPQKKKGKQDAAAPAKETEDKEMPAPARGVEGQQEKGTAESQAHASAGEQHHDSNLDGPVAQQAIDISDGQSQIRPTENKDSSAADAARAIEGVEPTLPAQMPSSSLPPPQEEEDARKVTPLPAHMIVGDWVRDAGRRHSVVRLAGPMGGYLEFRPKGVALTNERAPNGMGEAAHVKLEDGVWRLGQFRLDEKRSTKDELRWEDQKGSSRIWKREGVLQ